MNAQTQEIEARYDAVALMMARRSECLDCPSACEVIDHAIGAVNYHLRQLLRERAQ